MNTLEGAGSRQTWLSWRAWQHESVPCVLCARMDVIVIDCDDEMEAEPAAAAMPASLPAAMPADTTGAAALPVAPPVEAAEATAVPVAPPAEAVEAAAVPVAEPTEAAVPTAAAADTAESMDVDGGEEADDECDGPDEEEEEEDGEASDASDIYEVSNIVASRQAPGGGLEYLIKWKGWGAQFNSWEPEAHIIDPKVIAEFEAAQAEKAAKAAAKAAKRSPTKSARSSPTKGAAASAGAASSAADQGRNVELVAEMHNEWLPSYNQRALAKAAGIVCERDRNAQPTPCRNAQPTPWAVAHASSGRVPRLIL